MNKNSINNKLKNTIIKTQPKQLEVWLSKNIKVVECPAETLMFFLDEDSNIIYDRIYDINDYEGFVTLPKINDKVLVKSKDDESIFKNFVVNKMGRLEEVKPLNEKSFS